MAMGEEMTLQEFLSTPEVDLSEFETKLMQIGVRRVQHLEDVTAGDLAGVGMTSVELRRLQRSYEDYKKRMKKGKKFMSKVFGKKKKDSKPDLKEKQLSEERDERFVDMERENRYSHTDRVNDDIQPWRGSKRDVSTVCLIKLEDLALAEEIGKGEFGTVKRGVWTREDDMIPVAVKSLDGRRNKEERDAFVKEANVMHQIQHDNIIRLYGIVLSEPYRLVTELAPLGCLIDYLRAVPCKVSIYQLCDFSCQIACGMAYLEGKKYIHRDLAARNILLTSEDQVKISDFGLARAANQGEHTYIMSTNSHLPIAWTAPEALDSKEFTTACDVWSFGVTLWEMFSYGAEPYDGMSSPMQIFDFVRKKGRLSKPKNCPSKVWQVVQRCWDANPIDRPTFPYIERHLKACLPIKMRVTMDYNGKAAGEERLSMRKNDIVTVIEDQPPHFVGQNEAFEVGTFPMHCVVHLGDTTDKMLPNLQMKKLSVTSSDSGQESPLRRYMSMKPGQQLCTPDDDYLPMKPQYPQPGLGFRDQRAEEGAVRLALGEDVPVEPPPFQPMRQAGHIPAHTTGINQQLSASHVPSFTDLPQQHQVGLSADPWSQQVVSSRNPPLPYRSETEQVQISRPPDFDMYSANGGYEYDHQMMKNQSWQHSHALPSAHHPHPSVQLLEDISYQREAVTLQDKSRLMERLQEKLPDVQESDIRSMLVECHWNVEDAFQKIRVIQMMDLGLEGSTQEKCLRALEHCQWKIDRAAAWLMDGTI